MTATKSRRAGPLDVRVIGLAKIAEGLLVLVVGHRAPSLSLRAALWSVRRRARKADGGRRY